MKNKEKYFDELIQIIVNGYFLAVDERTNEPRRCDHKISCIECLFSKTGCSNGRKEWLEQEYQEPVTLTDDEKVILKNLPKKYEWIAKDKSGRLFLYLIKPLKTGVWWQSESTEFNFSMFNDLFQFIKWEDENAWEIDKLLKENGCERNMEKD